MKFPPFHLSFIPVNSYLYFMHSHSDSKESHVTYFLIIQVVGWNGDYNDVEHPLFDRGYTTHEHLPHFGLINMNGRVYDPYLGVFLSPDNYIQSPDNSQSLNRYTYALNNPLIYTDPTGEFVCFVVGGAILGSYIGASTSADDGFNLNPAKWGDDWGKRAIIGGIAGAGLGLGVSAGLSAAGANIKGIYASQWGATTLTWDITSNALLTANINMASGALQGRDLDGVFKSGLVGLASGGIGGYVGHIGYGKTLPMSEEAIKRMNYTTAGLNGFGDRFVYSLDKGDNFGKAFTNGLIGMAEGLYFANNFNNSKEFDFVNWGGVYQKIWVYGTYFGKILERSIYASFYFCSRTWDICSRSSTIISFP